MFDSHNHLQGVGGRIQQGPGQDHHVGDQMFQVWSIWVSINSFFQQKNNECTYKSTS